MNKRQKKKNFKKVVSEIINTCDNIDIAHKGDVIIFSISPRSIVNGGLAHRRIETIMNYCRESDIKAVAISNFKGLDVSVQEYDAAIEKLEQVITELKEKRDQLNK